MHSSYLILDMTFETMEKLHASQHHRTPNPNCTEAMAIFLILVGLLFESPKVPSKNPPFLLCVFVVPSKRL